MSYFGRHPTLKSSGADQVESWIPGFAGMTRVVVFSHPPLEGEVSRAERGTEGCHPHDGGTPLRLAFGQPPPLPGEDEGFAAAVGRFLSFRPSSCRA